MVVIRDEPLAHLLNERFISQNQSTAEGVSEHLPAEIIDEIRFAMLMNIFAQSFQPVALASAWKFRMRIHRPSAEIEFAFFADRTIRLENQTK